MKLWLPTKFKHYVWIVLALICGYVFYIYVGGYFLGKIGYEEKYQLVRSTMDKFQPPEGAIAYKEGWREIGKNYDPYGECFANSCPQIQREWLVQVIDVEEKSLLNKLLNDFKASKKELFCPGFDNANYCVSEGESGVLSVSVMTTKPKQFAWPREASIGKEWRILRLTVSHE